MHLPALVILFLLANVPATHSMGNRSDNQTTCNITCSSLNSPCSAGGNASTCQVNCSSEILHCEMCQFPSGKPKLQCNCGNTTLQCDMCKGQTENMVRKGNCDIETTTTTMQATSLPMTDTGIETSTPISTGSSSTHDSTSDQTSETATTPGVITSTKPTSTTSSPPTTGSHMGSSTAEGHNSTDGNSTPNAQKSKTTGPDSWRIIVPVVIIGVIAVVIVIALFLLRRKGIICAREPERDHQMKSLKDSLSESGNPYHRDPSAPDLGESAQPHSSSRNPNNGDASRLEPSAPAYFTVEPDWTSRLASNASRDGPAASAAAARRAGDDNAYQTINDEDIRPLPSEEKYNDDYNKLGERKGPDSNPSGSEYGHLAFGGVDDGYDHVTKGKKTEAKVRHRNDDDKVPEGAAGVDSGNYYRLFGGAGEDLTAACGDYDTPPPPRKKDSGYVSRALGQDDDADPKSDYDYPPSPKKVKKSLNSGAPSSTNGKMPSSGAYELAAPLSPGGSAGEGTATSAGGSTDSPGTKSAETATFGTTSAERQESEEDTPGSPQTSGSPYELASTLS